MQVKLERWITAAPDTRKNPDEMTYAADVSRRIPQREGQQ
jgi:hypothetical protein